MNKDFSNQLDIFIREFVEITAIEPHLDSEYVNELEPLIQYIKQCHVYPIEERKRLFLGHVNKKFKINSRPLAKFYELAAKSGFTFNYHQKCAIQRSFDFLEEALFKNTLLDKGVCQTKYTPLYELYLPLEHKVTVSFLHQEYKEPSKLRKEVGNRNISGEITKALFSAFIWVSVSEQEMHKYFDPYYSESAYESSFWNQFQLRSTELFKRDNSLDIIRLDSKLLEKFNSLDDVRDYLGSTINAIYNDLNNYGIFAVLVEDLKFEDREVQWEIAGDIMLYAEKHRERKIKNTYFRSKVVEQNTKAYIPEINDSCAQFEIANEGFTYRDCFVLSKFNENDNQLALLLIFQKNHPDETIVPCPRCRSVNVEGNSYPSLGVKSWECSNPFCPERSKYNRGKRYSFKQLIMQQAIDDEKNEIPIESVRRWARDVVENVSYADVIEMLIKHYSIYTDTVHLMNWPEKVTDSFGRKILEKALDDLFVPDEKSNTFWDSSFFKRYVLHKEQGDITEFTNMGDDKFIVYQGDSFEVLKTVPANFFDGAVTSPPYYNAREYSQWANLYCYLYDMHNINSQVFRTLKPGSLYFYNIFDYFDNENIIVLSDMGRKRLILSAYTIDMFRRIGFKCVGNIVWDKGEIEGKRGFNAGNFSPYYQTPFNCWEHVLVFQKPSKEDVAKVASFKSSVLAQKPVIKMFNGKNMHGHTAPFPDAIPELCLSYLKPNDWVLDPFGGSLTTGRVAARYGISSVCIEKLSEYCELGLNLHKNDTTKYSGNVSIKSDINANNTEQLKLLV